MPDDEAEEMTSKLARSGNFLILTFTKTKGTMEDGDTGERVRVKQREHWFFKVEVAKELKFRPFDTSASITAYNQEVGNGPVPSLEPDQGTAALPLLDQNGNDILRNDEDDWLVYHVTVQPLQEDIRVYPQIPESQPNGVFEYLGANRPSGAAGDVVGYVDGNDNPNWYDPEAGIAETLVYNQGGDTTISYQFYNDSDERRLTPKLSITGAGYVLTPITDEGVQRNLLDAAADNDPAVTQLEWGAIRESFSYEVPAGWSDADNYIEELTPHIPERFKDDGEAEDGGD